MSDAPTGDPALLTPLTKLTKDLREAARTLGKAEARYLVDAYYKIQEDRIRSAHQVRTLSEPKGDEAVPEPHDVIAWLQLQEEILEGQIKRALDAYSDSQVEGRWCKSICGIGPVIAAGLLAHIDISRAPTAGHIWRYAGLDPTTKWNKGEKRPWNASLKRLCFIIGESFTKVSNNKNDIYGQYYKARKALEIERNEAGMFAEQAAASLAAKRFGDDTEAKKHYLAGRLPPARIHLRAQRYATKLFLADLHCVMYFAANGVLPPKPYVITHLGHVHHVGPPNADLVPGLPEALCGIPTR